jgi:hypothetical protein
MALTKRYDLETELVRTLGLEPSRVRSVSIRLAADSVPVATVEMFVEDFALESITKTLKEWVDGTD